MEESFHVLATYYRQKNYKIIIHIIFHYFQEFTYFYLKQKIKINIFLGHIYIYIHIWKKPLRL